jgi:protein TonB
MPHLSFTLALLLSVVLHSLLFGAGEVTRLFAPAALEQHTPARLDARLLPMPPTSTIQPLLKNTLVATTEVPAPVTPPPATSPRSKRASVSRTPPAVEQKAQRKLAEHMFYPEEAVAQGLEGEVRLLLRLAPDGTIVDVQIASGSGHALLDQAALNAARNMHRLPDTGVTELILPVVFRLQ